MSNSKQTTVVLRSQQSPLPSDQFTFLWTAMPSVYISTSMQAETYSKRCIHRQYRTMLGANQSSSFRFSNTKERREQSFPFSFLFSLLANKINGFLVVFFLKENRTLCDGKAVLQARPNQKTKRELETAKKQMWCIMGPICLYWNLTLDEQQITKFRLNKCYIFISMLSPLQTTQNQKRTIFSFQSEPFLEDLFHFCIYS